MYLKIITARNLPKLLTKINNQIIIIKKYFAIRYKNKRQYNIFFNLSFQLYCKNLLNFEFSFDYLSFPAKISKVQKKKLNPGRTASQWNAYDPVYCGPPVDRIGI